MTTRTLSPDKQAQKAVKWIEKARLRKGDNSRPELHQVFYAPDYALGTDGYRIHQAFGEFEQATEMLGTLADLADGIKRAKDTARNATTSATVATSQLAMLAKQSLAFNYGHGFNMRLYFTAEGLFTSAKSAEWGDWESALIEGDEIPHWRKDKYKIERRIAEPVIYRQSGPAVEMAVSPKYLIDALAGMGEQTTIRARPDMLDLQSGDAEAVIMGMHLGR